MDSINHIEMRNISVAFGDVSVLNQVDFRLDGGSVHALTGANGAGKSTLMAVLCGSYDHYQGDIYLNGERLSLRTPGDAKRAGIHLVQQEVDSGLIPGLSVGENIMLDRLAEPGHFYNWQSVYRQASHALAQLNVAIDIKKPIEQCSLAEKQQVLLARALTHNCRFLILDEPTAPLDEQESTRLFNVVSKLQQTGIGIVFISHRIHELKAVCDRMTVLRDGKRVESCPMGQLSGEQIVEKMLGHALDNLYPAKRPAFSGHILLDVTGLHDEKCLKDINLRLHSGEIIGIAGLVGAGKTELCKALFGASASTLTRGELNGRAWRPTDPADAVADGIVLVPEERRKEGIFIDESLTMNLSICADTQFSRAGFFSIKKATHWAQEIIRRLAIKTHGPAQTLRRLSGGNQQKAAIGKWLRSHADILIFDEPTKGIDIKAKTDLFVLIDALARQGKCIIYASGKFAELTGLCDRIYVLWDGRIVAELTGSQATEETLLLYSTGGSPT